MHRKAIALFAFVSVFGLATSTSAVPPMRYVPMSSARPNYDYAPTVVWDAASSKWVMFTCSGDGFDALFRATSSDGLTWTYSATPSLQVADSPNWDNFNVCDPSVLRNVTINGQLYPWVLFYSGAHHDFSAFYPDGKPDHRLDHDAIGLATSADGLTFTRFRSPRYPAASDTGKLYDCPAPGVCNQAAVSYDGTRFVMVQRYDHGTCDKISRALTSVNGIDWTVYPLGSAACGEAGTFDWLSRTGPDIMFDQGSWYLASGGDNDCGGPNTPWGGSDLRLFKANSLDEMVRGVGKTIGCLPRSEWRDVASDPVDMRAYAVEEGFFRDGSGARPGADIWIAFGRGFSSRNSDKLREDPATEDIQGAKLGLLDGEQCVDRALTAGTCFGGSASQSSSFGCRVADGPGPNDDYNYWIVTRNGSGSASPTDYCEQKLTNLPSMDLTRGNVLDVTWTPAAQTSTKIQLELGIVDSSGFRTLGSVTRPSDQLARMERFSLDHLATRASTSQISFRIHPSSMPNGANAFIRINSVRVSQESPGIVPLPEVVIGDVRNNAGLMFSVSSRTNIADRGSDGWNHCPTGYVYLGRDFSVDGFWLCVRSDLVGRTFYVGDAVSRLGALNYFSVTQSATTSLGQRTRNTCDNGSTLLGTDPSSDGFWVCMTPPGPEVMMGDVRADAGYFYSVEGRGVGSNWVSLLGTDGWNSCPTGYTPAGYWFDSYGFWLCARNDLSARTFFVGDVEGGRGNYFRVQGGAATRMADQGWNACVEGSQWLGTDFGNAGFWICLK